MVTLGNSLGCYRVDNREVFYLIWGQWTGQFRSGGLWQQLLWGLVSSRDFYPVTLVQGSTPVALVYSPTSPLFLFMDQIFSPLTPCSWITVYLSLSWAMGTQVIGERADDCSGFFKLDRGVVGFWVPVADPSGWSQLGYIYRGDESPWSDKTSCSTTVWVLAWWYSCCTTSGRLSCILEERNLTRRLRIYGPKINRSRKAAKRLARRTRTRCWSVMVVFL